MDDEHGVGLGQFQCRIIRINVQIFCLWVVVLEEAVCNSTDIIVGFYAELLHEPPLAKKAAGVNIYTRRKQGRVK